MAVAVAVAVVAQKPLDFVYWRITLVKSSEPLGKEDCQQTQKPSGTHLYKNSDDTMGFAT